MAKKLTRKEFNLKFDNLVSNTWKYYKDGKYTIQNIDDYILSLNTAPKPNSLIENTAPDIIRQILLFMDSEDVLSFCSTSRYTNQICDYPLFWKQLTNTRYKIDNFIFGNNFKEQIVNFKKNPKLPYLTFLLGKIFYYWDSIFVPNKGWVSEILFVQILGWPLGSEQIYSKHFSVYLSKLLTLPSSLNTKDIDETIKIDEILNEPLEFESKHKLSTNFRPIKSKKYFLVANVKFEDNIIKLYLKSSNKQITPLNIHQMNISDLEYKPWSEISKIIFKNNLKRKKLK